jgi:hypothetical protein
MISCPDVELLQRFLRSELSDEESTEVSAHLDNCTICEQAVAQLVANADFPAVHVAGRPTISERWPSIPGYELIDELGRGGMGIVYKALHLGLKRVVALKMIRAGSRADVADTSRFRTEAEAVARFKHPNIVQIYEIGTHDGMPYFSLEYAEGGSLAKKLAGTPQPPRESAALVETLARAMHTAHGAGVIHRDLKPANVLLTDAGVPKIADFGLAKRLDEEGQTMSGALVGTPSYMAPEQAEGKTKEIGPAADVYALGAVLYECLTGRPPFKGATHLETIEQVKTQDPVAPRQLNPKVPRDLETICLKCLQKEVRKRYPTAEELADDLQRCVEGRPIVARPAGRVERGWRWCRRKPLVAGLLALVALSLVTGTAVSTYFAIDASDQAAQARDNQKKADDQAKQTSAALDKAEDTLIASWLRQIGQHGGPVDLMEREALLDLASQENSEIRHRFLERGLQRPDTAVRLARRTEQVMVAVVGLDPAERQKALQALRIRGLDQKAALPFRLACVRLALALDEMDPQFTENAAGLLLDAIVEPGYGNQRFPLLGALKRLAGRPNRVVAPAVGQRVLKQIEDAQPDNLYIVSTAVAELTDFLDEATANQAAKHLLARMERLSGSFAVQATALAALARRMNAMEADKLAENAQKIVLQRRKGVNISADQAEALATLAGCRVNSAEAAQGLWDLRRVAPPQALPVLVKAFIAVTDRLSPHKAAKLRVAAGAELLQQLRNDARTLDYAAAANLERVLTAANELGAVLPPEDAAAVMNLILTEMKDGKKLKIIPISQRLRTLAAPAARLAARSEPADADRAARQILDHLADSKDSSTLPPLAKLVRALTDRLEPEKAAELRATAAAPLLKKLKNADLIYDSNALWAANELGIRLHPREAAEAMTPILKGLQHITNELRDRPPDNFKQDSGTKSFVTGYVYSGAQLLVWLEPAYADRVAMQFLDYLDEFATPEFDDVDVSPIVTILASRMTKQALVDVLTRPVGSRTVREIVLKRLKEITRGQFVTVWDFVAWAREHEPTLDLSLPVRRPQP